MDVTVVVGTYGDPSWVDLAHKRAIPSVEALDVPHVYVHGDSLHEARNTGLDQVRTEWVCVLDADDELTPRFFDHMAHGTADVRAPSVEYVVHSRRRPARMPKVAGHTHDCTADCLPDGNWLVIGSVARTDLLREVGGFHDWPVYEDWDLWLRCHLAGATLAPVPRAVYRAHVRPQSRNRAPDREMKDRTHHEIRAACLGATR